MITHSPTLHAGQSAAWTRLWPTPHRLDELAARLDRGQTRRQRAAVEADIAAICSARWVDRVVVTELTGSTPTTLRLSWRIDHTARAALQQRLFGKRILFTNRDTWPIGDVVAAYRSQSEAESGFRQLKDPHVVSFSPIHHFTDNKIPGTRFCCVLALAIAHLMRRQAHHAGLQLSVRDMLEQWAASAKPCCSTTTAAKAVPAPGACSPT